MIKKIVTVELRVWEPPDDIYFVVPEIQVFSPEFKLGDMVEVTIRKINKN